MARGPHAVQVTEEVKVGPAVRPKVPVRGMPLAERRWSEGGRRLGRGARSLAPVEAPVPPELPFRLRYVLLVAILLASAGWVFPRGRSAWRLHNLGTALAEHALCMAGPTGPRLLREDPGALAELLRRRVVMAAPQQRPFVACTEFADQIEMPVRSRQAYSRTAVEFREYSGDAEPRAEFSVRDFDFGRAGFEALARAAWPFVREGQLRLVEPPAHAKEGVHPLVPPSPGFGRGLPARGYAARATMVDKGTIIGAFGSGVNAELVISKDGGRTFVPGGRERSSELLDRCFADPGGPAFSLSRTDAGRHVALSLDVDGPPTAALLGEADERVVGVSCDAQALVAVLSKAKAGVTAPSVRLRQCPLRQACRDVAPPTGLALAEGDLDVARVAGDTVLVATRGGISRVASTRDDGATWTPVSVAFDAISAGLPAGAAPSMLLTVGPTVLLYGRPHRTTGTYVLLSSADHGASFRALGSGAPPRDGRVRVQAAPALATR